MLSEWMNWSRVSCDLFDYQDNLRSPCHEQLNHVSNECLMTNHVSPFSTWMNYWRIVRLDVQLLQPRVSRLLEDSRSSVSSIAWSRRKEWEGTTWKGLSRQDALNDTSRDMSRCTGTLMSSILRLLRDILWRYCVLHDLLRRFQLWHHFSITFLKY